MGKSLIRRSHILTIVAIGFMMYPITLVLAQTAESISPKSNITATYKNVENMVTGLTDSVESMSRALKAGKEHAATVDKDFDRMEEKFRLAADALGEGSEIRNDLIANIEQMEGYIVSAREKIKSTTGKKKQEFWIEDAEYWEKNVALAIKLRNRIFKGSDLLIDQVAQLSDQKDIVKALMRREWGEKTVLAMETVAQELDTINAELGTLLREIQQDAGLLPSG